MNLIDRFIYKYTRHIIGLMLVGMFLLGILSVKQDAPVTKEITNISAGYSYLKYNEVRFDLSEPVLIKNIAASPLLFMDLDFPQYEHEWKTGLGDSKQIGQDFFYTQSNNPDKILFWSRAIILLLLSISGIFIYKLGFEIGKIKNKFTGRLTGILATFFYCFCPNILANSRYAQTEMLKIIIVLLTLFALYKYLKHYNKRNILLLIISIGLIITTTYNALILLIFIPLFAMAFYCIQYFGVNKFEKAKLKTYSLAGSKKLGKLFLTMLGGIVLAYLIYLPQTSSMTEVKIKQLAKPTPHSKTIDSLAKNSVSKPIAVYLLGQAKANHLQSNEINYIDGNKVSTKNITQTNIIKLFLYKNSIVCILFILLAIIINLTVFILSVFKNKKNGLIKSLKNYFIENILYIILIFYFLAEFFYIFFEKKSLYFEQFLPIFILLILFIAKNFIQAIYLKNPNPSESQLKFLALKAAGVGMMIMTLFWYLGINLYTYPYYLTHFNEIALMSNERQDLAIANNLDQGQDLIRLKNWVNAQDINQIYVDYYGEANINYYLKAKYQPITALKKDGSSKWVAVSATNLKNKLFSENKEFYEQLNKLKPLETIGNTIFIYHTDKLSFPISD